MKETSQSQGQLIEYVRRARASGIADNQIRQDLLNAGWPEADISASLQANVIPATDPVKSKFSFKVKIAVFASVLLLIGGVFAFYFHRTYVPKEDLAIESSATPKIAQTQNENGFTLRYKEKRKLEIEPWPFQNVHLADLQDGALRHAVRVAYESKNSVDANNVIYTKLPPDFIAKLPPVRFLIDVDKQFIDSYTRSYFTENGKAYHVAINACLEIVAPSQAAVCQEDTFFTLWVETVDKPSSMSTSLLWNKRAGLDLSKISPEGTVVPKEEYQRNKRFYDSLNGGGLYIYDDYAYIGIETIPTILAQKEPVAGEVNTSNWETYKNTDFGFKIGYPARLTLSGFPEEGKGNSQTGLLVSFTEENVKYGGFWIQISTDTPPASLEQLEQNLRRQYRNDDPSSPNQRIEREVLDNEGAVTVAYDVTEYGHLVSREKIYFVLKTGRLYTFLYSYSDIAHFSIFENMIRSIQFF